jgi:hypothetical protein
MKIPTNEEINALLLPLVRLAKERNPDVESVCFNIEDSGKPPFVKVYGGIGNCFDGDYGIEVLDKIPNADETRRLRIEKLRSELESLESGNKQTP